MASNEAEPLPPGGDGGVDTNMGSEEAAVPPATSYAAALQQQLAHAPVQATELENRVTADRMLRHEQVEPELVAAATHLGQFSHIHPTRARPGELLPEGVSRSSACFLIKTLPQKVVLSKEKIRKEMDYFLKQVIIAYFVGGRQSARAMAAWVTDLSSEIKDSCKIGRELGQGFFQVVTNAETITQKILMLTPHLSKWRTCIMQAWIPSFNAHKPTGMKMPIWITLKSVPDEFLSSSSDLAQSVGDVLGRYKGNAYNAD